jgi:hypothetical protein
VPLFSDPILNEIKFTGIDSTAQHGVLVQSLL